MVVIPLLVLCNLMDVYVFFSVSDDTSTKPEIVPENDAEATRPEEGEEEKPAAEAVKSSDLNTISPTQVNYIYMGISRVTTKWAFHIVDTVLTE